MPATYVLVHSPIVGPGTWEPVADRLREHAERVVVPELPRGNAPFWRAHVTSVVEQVDPADTAGPAVVVAHSGSGKLVAHIGTGLRARGVEVGGYLLVDAGLPSEGGSRLDQLRDQDPEAADRFEEHLASGRAFPDWDDEVLAPLVPDGLRRAALIEQLRPLPMSYWTEPIPAVDAWPDAPCGVVVFSHGYEATARHAEEHGWPLRRLDGDNHFHLMAHEDQVAGVLRAMVAELLGSAG